MAHWNSLPAIRAGVHVARPRLIKLLNKAHRSASCLMVVGRAGQGKTTAVAQWVAETGLPVCWHATEEEDRDPIGFMTRIVLGVVAVCPEFSKTPFGQIALGHRMGAGDEAELGRMLAHSLSLLGERAPLLVLDDIHTLDGATASLEVLHSLVGHGGRKGAILLISRYPVGALPGRDSGVARMGNEALLFTHEETEELCDLLGEDDGLVPSEIQKRSEGWVMGVLACIHAGRAGRSTASYSGSELDFTLFEALPKASLDALCLLALPDCLPAELARQIVPGPGVIEGLDRLVAINHFIRFSSSGHYLFHHLFQLHLRQEARRRFDAETLHSVLSGAARFFDASGDFEIAIRHAIRGEDVDQVEEILHRSGLSLMVMQHEVGMHETLSNIPESEKERRGWLALFSALSAFDIQPLDVPGYLAAADTCMKREGDLVGQFLTHTQWVVWQLAVEGCFEDGAHHLRAAEALETAAERLLPVGIYARALNIMALGSLFIDGNVQESQVRSDRVQGLTRDLNAANLMAETQIVKCYQQCFLGDIEGFRMVLESLVNLAQRQGVNAYTQLMSRLVQLNMLSTEGDAGAYRYLRDELVRQTEAKLQVQGRLIPFLVVWDADMAISEGNAVEARARIDEGLAMPVAGDNAQMRSQYLHLKGYLAAIQGERDLALAAIQESLRLRDQSGGPYYILRNRIIAGATLRHLGAWDKARDYLDEAVRSAVAMNDGIGHLAACAQRAVLFLALKKEPEARQDIAQMNRLRKAHGMFHFFTAEPGMLETLARAARALGEDPEYIESLHAHWSKARLWKKTIVPHVTVKILGRFELWIEGRKSLLAQLLTPSQQELLSLLFIAPHHRMHVEKLQAALWPEASAEKARASFDGLLARLRKVFKRIVAPYPVEPYLRLEKQVLCLDHMTIDLAQFMDAAHEGGLFAARSMAWSALCQYRQAHACWGRPFLPGCRLNTAVEEFLHTRLYPLYRKSIRVWAGQLLDATTALPQDLELLEQAVDVDTVEPVLVRVLYHHLRQNGDALRARRLLRRYRSLLQQEEMSGPEIDGLLEHIWAETSVKV
ncbi:AAA family ATPase [Desulfoluna sp.]|uniref:AAA family ATPase n=1 Tax=Desulfoluna sp. TaxID=2045199 RepID=UPI0026118E88|nr:AAA family ATPase [Desulfoluna sp.]